MATITFYEKPGCINNTRQKKLIAAAGHQVIAKNLLTEIEATSAMESCPRTLAQASCGHE
jgi:hypothetical protein